MPSVALAMNVTAPNKRCSRGSERDAFIVPALSFKALANRFDIAPPQPGTAYDLIKLDIEGLEAPLLEDIIAFYRRSHFLVLVEILTPTTFESIQNQVTSGDGLALAYINDYEQTISQQEAAQFRRQRGSRNFLLGSSELIADLCNTPPHELLENYE
jgi:hypothetical protein